MVLFANAKKTMSTKTLLAEHAQMVCLQILPEQLVYVKIALVYLILILSNVLHSQKIANLVKIILVLNAFQVIKNKIKHV